VFMVCHELVERDAIALKVCINKDVGHLSGVAHFRRSVESSVVLSLAEFKDWLDILLIGNNKVVALQVKCGFHAYSSGTTLTTPAAVS
jgi:hypothetical protein